MSKAVKTKMAEKLNEEETLAADSDERKCTEDGNSSVEKRYSMKEANEIGKEMLESIQSALMPKAGSVEKKDGIQDPYVKAWKYMEERDVLLMLEILLTKLVYERPDVPMQFMADEIHNMKGKNLRSCQPYTEETTEK